ncbi:MAG TPA: Crp/Fnr family transcriptional regulator [Terriglobales bacterium]|nr:Crp/Fnr family transcriptional regulator [Terriglobales bacterium]HVN19266.1 Crp/Fnr family transcriptional regulator [Dongiaceae bacterium]
MAATVPNNAQKFAPRDKTFCDLPPAVAGALEQEALTTVYPREAVLFEEGQAAKGVFIVRQGRVKLAISRGDRTLILRIVNPGGSLGMAAVIAARKYEATAETLERCEISFIRQRDVRRLMCLHADLALWVTEHLSKDYANTCREIGDLMLSDSPSERFARFLLGLLDQNIEPNSSQVELVLTREEIGQMIGTSRETVSRLFASFTKRNLIRQGGGRLVMPHRVALESLIAASDKPFDTGLNTAEPAPNHWRRFSLSGRYQQSQLQGGARQ